MTELRWIMATKEAFEKYPGVVITTERLLSNGKHILHDERANDILMNSHLDKDIVPYTHDAMMAYIEFCEPTE